MSATQIWIVIAGMAIVTTVTRAFFLIGGERTVLPERVQRLLRYAPAAALVAVVLPDSLMTRAGVSFGLSNHDFYAMLSGVAWFMWRRTMLGTIVTGMVVFTLMRLFL
jgi:branched-subunit amino acid transport protein